MYLDRSQRFCTRRPSLLTSLMTLWMTSHMWMTSFMASLTSRQRSTVPLSTTRVDESQSCRSCRTRRHYGRHRSAISFSRHLMGPATATTTSSWQLLLHLGARAAASLRWWTRSLDPAPQSIPVRCLSFSYHACTALKVCSKRQKWTEIKLS